MASVVLSHNFKREVKPLLKKYASLRKELGTLIEELSKQPRKGIRLTSNCYKIRLAVKSKRKGKSGGLRIITHVTFEVVETVKGPLVILLSVYDKSNLATLSDKDLKGLLRDIESELRSTGLIE
ncbi:MAG: hypothetical protein ACPGWR_19245 [Ardenticatenaceae bacterium]